SYSERSTSSLTKYDFPAPLLASTTELWLCWAHRSHHTIPAESVFNPYSTPPEGIPSPGRGAGRSALARGNVAARLSVSKTRRIRIESTPRSALNNLFILVDGLLG